MPPFSLSGQVTDATTHAGLAGVTVKVVAGSGSNFGKTAITDATGHYTLSGLTAGTIIVEAFIAGYNPADVMLTITANATHNFQLTSATYTLSGQVTDALTSAPVRDALVKIVGGSGTNFGKSAITNATGHYSITGLTPGTIIVEAYLAYQPKDQILTVTSNTTQNFALTK